MRVKNSRPITAVKEFLLQTNQVQFLIEIKPLDDISISFAALWYRALEERQF